MTVQSVLKLGDCKSSNITELRITKQRFQTLVITRLEHLETGLLRTYIVTCSIVKLESEARAAVARWWK